MNKLIDTVSRYPYDFDQLERCFANDKRIKVRFCDLDDENLENMFRNGTNVVLMLLPIVGHTKPVFHWSVFLKHNKINFFESFGLNMRQLDVLLGSSKLTDFLKKHKIVTNTTQLQDDLKTESSCGAHVVCRALYGLRKNNKQYVKFLKTATTAKMTPDELVTLLTVSTNYPNNIPRLKKQIQRVVRF